MQWTWGWLGSRFAISCQNCCSYTNTVLVYNLWPTVTTHGSISLRTNPVLYLFIFGSDFLQQVDHYHVQVLNPQRASLARFLLLSVLSWFFFVFLIPARFTQLIVYVYAWQNLVIHLFSICNEVTAVFHDKTCIVCSWSSVCSFRRHSTIW